MTEVKAFVCCGSTEKPWDGISCKIEEIADGLRLSITGDDPEQIKKLKEKARSCCGSGGGETDRGC